MLKKKTVILIAAILITSICFSILFIACEKSSDGETDAPVGDGNVSGYEPVQPTLPPQAKSFYSALKYICDICENSRLSVAASGRVFAAGAYCDLLLNGNYSERVLKAALNLTKTDGEYEAGLYIDGTNIYLRSFDGKLLDLSAINADESLIGIDKLPSAVRSAIENALESAGLSLSFDSVMELLCEMMLTDEIEYSQTDGSERFSINFDTEKMIGNLSAMLELINKDNVAYLREILAQLPCVKGNLRAVIDRGKMTELTVELSDSNAQNPAYGKPVNLQVQISDKDIEVEMPDDLSDAQEFGIGNVNAQLQVNVDADGLDLGAFFDALLAKQFIGNNNLTLKGSYSVAISTTLDISSDSDDNNLLSIQFYSEDGETARIFYMDSMLYVNVGDKIKYAHPLNLPERIARLRKVVKGFLLNLAGNKFPYLENINLSNKKQSDASEFNNIWLRVLIQTFAAAGLGEYIKFNGEYADIILNQTFADKFAEIAGTDRLILPFDSLLRLDLGGIDRALLLKFAGGELTLNLKDLNIGISALTRNSVEEGIGDKSLYAVDVEQAVKDYASKLLEDFSLEAIVDIKTLDTQLNLSDVVNNVLAMTDSRFEIPVNIDLSNYSGRLKIEFLSRFGSSRDGRVMLKVSSVDGSMSVGLYVDGENAYFDLTGIGLSKFAITNFDLSSKIKDIIGMTVATEGSDINGSKSTFFSGEDLRLKNFFDIALSLLLGGRFNDLGLDYSTNTRIDSSGKMICDIDLGIGVIKINLSAGKASDNEDFISLDSGEYCVYDALNSNTLAESMLRSQNLDFTLDFYNNNCDTLRPEKTRLILRRSLATSAGRTELLPNGDEAPYGAVVFALFDGWTGATADAYFWGYIDLDGKVLQISAAERMFKNLTTVLDISLASLSDQLKKVVKFKIDNFDAKAALSRALSAIMGEQDYDGYIPIPDGALPRQMFSDRKINRDIISAADVNLSSTGDVDIRIRFDAAVISKRLNSYLTDLFADLDISRLFGREEGAIVVSIPYDNVNKDVFFDNLYSQAIKPALEHYACDYVGLLNSVNIKDIIREVVSRFLPLSYVEELSAGVSITDGIISGISLTGIGADGRGYYAKLFGKRADSAISWEGQESELYYYPSLGISIQDSFSKRARQISASGKQSYQTIVWAINGNAIADWSELDAYPDGDYEVTGYAFDSALSVRLRIRRTQVAGIKDFSLKAARKLPDYVTVVFADGSEETICGVTIFCQSRVNSTTPNASVVLGGKKYAFNVYFEEERINLQTLTVNAFNYRDVFDSMKEDCVVKALINEKIYRYLPVDFNGALEIFQEMTREQLQKGASYNLDVFVGGDGCGIERQRATLTVEFVPFAIYGIEIYGNPYIETDMWEYAAGRSFPDEVVAVGFDGEREIRYTARADWHTDKLAPDIKGGNYVVSLTLNKGYFNEWYIPSIATRFVSGEIVSPVREELILDGIYFYYGGVDLDRIIPKSFDFYTADGCIIRGVPARLDTGAIDFSNIKGGEYFCNLSVFLSVDGESKTVYSASIKVIVPSVTMTLCIDSVTVDYDEYVRLNGHVFADRMDIMLGDYTTEAKITWFTDDVKFDEDGAYTAYVIIAEGTDYEQICPIAVNIVNSPCGRFAL